MRTSILSVVSALSLAFAAPYNPPTCGQRSSQVSDFTVKDFDFHASYIFTTPAHQNSWGYVNFTLTNSAVDYPVECSAASSQLNDFFYGTQVYQCKVPNKAEAGPATFTFSRPSGDLMINQTWYCPQEGSRYEAHGGTRLNLTCADKYEQNPDWKPGQIYSTRTVTCDHVTAQARITEISAVA
ncbi:hypothetical protein CDD82_5508 [Ophiocordyceps australis]|uniref:AA1-like domain-containing protein n=1 Tax=Ophiocordyceps australis TaxID=1399860 RepID=A0A2C5ZRZ4_9HYPO|nr:hypothetical protein CDD82_5508 [Ophiocordyceps australis]